MPVPMKVSNWLLMVTGGWILLAPFVLVQWTEAFFSGEAYYPAAVYWNNIGVGLALGALAAARLWWHRGVWAAWVDAVIGAWLLFSPWFLLYTAHNTITTNNVIFGLVTIGLGIWSGAYTATTRRAPTFAATEPEEREPPPQ